MADHRYNPAEIEPKWQKHWEEKRTFRALDPGDPGFDPARPKYYVLDMFPYPSGAGLHVGHPEGYTATDILARFKRMRGFNVLHPMGWDAFGLPAEQYAIQTGTHPSITTSKNIETFGRQIRALGFSYDWDREISTTHEKYVRWTQWIFQLLYDTWYDEESGKGRPIAELPIPEGTPANQVKRYQDSRRLAYLDEIAVWWCSDLGTVLSNEEVIDGRSERGSYPCVRLPLRQWMLRITAYAGRLLRDLEIVQWPEETKKQQSEWIGESHGAEVWFSVADVDPKSCEALADGEKIRIGTEHVQFKIFTTCPDTLYGATFMVLAPEHPLVDCITTEDEWSKVQEYRSQAASKSDLDRTAHKDKTGVWTGAYALHPLTGARVPIWIADYVLATYGTGAIMSVPAHDQRDFDFAKTFALPMIQVIEPLDGGDCDFPEKAFCGPGRAVNSPWIDGQDTAQAKKTMCDQLQVKGLGRSRTTYRLRDWIFSRQRYWGEPFPIVHGPDGPEAVPSDQLPVTLPEMEDFRPSGNPEPPLAKASEWVTTVDSKGRPARRETNTMPNWAGSCWYFLRFCDPRNDQMAWDREKEKYWMPVDLYVGGREHAVLHLLYARFWQKVLFDRGYVSHPEPFGRLFHQGLILAFSYEDAATKVLVPSDMAVEKEPGVFVHKDTGAALNQVLAKMSKTLKNVANPDDVLREHGADAFRTYEMFMGPLEDAKPWNSRDIGGVSRFLQRIWRLVVDDESGQCRQFASESDPALERHLHRCIKKVTDDLERMAFNTAVSAMMIFLNETSGGALTKSQMERFVLLVSAFAPHLGEELWERLGHAESLAYHPWPTYDEAMLEDETVEIPVQVNGKVRSRVIVARDADQAELEARAREAVANLLDGKAIRKVVVVPKRMVNVVVG